ncbi:MAG: TPM domain-containing protein [Micavibrio aeruginosavorus]|uniref:TPM domain-containing protein n=1 Tax=Micavibrio aeruginosavorus TaxID=349221 RepID=A0A7T5UGE2_9BACT|nr:MAG: TPM domain-containing protein [Micavibrio aeruginosavorus]
MATPGPGATQKIIHVLVSALAASCLIFPGASVAGSRCHKDLVCDSAGVFTEQQMKDLETYHAALREQYDIDYRIMVADNIGDLSAYAAKIFASAEIGQHSKSRKGMFLLLDPAQDQVRLEISAGLDAVYTDGFVAYLQQRQMVPFFQANRVADGILATTEMIVTRAQDAEAGKEFIAPEQLPDNLSIGAGAKTQAHIGSGYQQPQPTAASPSTPLSHGMSPEQVVAAYHYALSQNMGSPDLDIYSSETREMKKTWVVTPAQMRNELNAYRKCDIDQTAYIKDNTLAVVRYKVDQRQCAPYFLVMEDGAWRLDFRTMMENIRFNVSNEWHFDMSRPLPYADAFADWDFNKNGYPFPQRKLRWGINVNTDYRKDITTIHKIFPDTPAASMGLREGDIILRWDGIKKPDHKKIVKSMDALEDGETLTVEVIRDGQPLTFNLKAPPKVK